MIATLAFVTLATPLAEWKVGSSWTYMLTTQYQNAQTNFTEEEQFDLKISAKNLDSYEVKGSRKLLATIVDGNRVPTSAGLEGEAFNAKWSSKYQLLEWGLSTNPVEARFQRLLIGSSLPTPVKRYESRLSESNGIPTAYMIADRNPQSREPLYDFSYRELEDMKIIGYFELTPQYPLPRKLVAKVTRIQIPGGSEYASCLLTLTLKPEK